MAIVYNHGVVAHGQGDYAWEAVQGQGGGYLRHGHVDHGGSLVEASEWSGVIAHGQWEAVQG